MKQLHLNNHDNYLRSLFFLSPTAQADLSSVVFCFFLINYSKQKLLHLCFCKLYVHGEAQWRSWMEAFHEKLLVTSPPLLHTATQRGYGGRRESSRIKGKGHRPAKGISVPPLAQLNTSSLSWIDV